VKKFLFLLFVSILAVTVTACQSTTSDVVVTTNDNRVGYKYNFSEDKKETTTIKVWADDTDGLFMQELIKEFNKVYPEILVDFTHMGTVDARERLQLMGEKGADIIQFPHDHLAPALEADLLYALPTSYANSLNERMSDISMSIATACFDFETSSFECDGTNENVFAAPLSVESIALFYNKSKVTTPATTFESLIEEFAAYPDADVASGKYLFNTNYNDSYFLTFALTAFGYSPFGPNQNDPDHVGLNSDAVIKGLTWLKNEISPLYGAGTTASNIQALADSKFEAGELPYIITGPWKIETYKALDFEVGVTTIPTINIDGVDVAPKPFVGAQMAGVYKFSNNKEAALTFLQFWTSEKGLEIQYNFKGKLPALKDELIDEIDVINNDEYLKGIRAQITNTIPMPTIPEIQHYWEPVRIMFTEAWAGGDPASIALKAENSYNASRNLGQ
jgi:arabinogalactan oligomer/maltooligosaccharide transport system substrate-binding protein